ncbi:uncharacterized protein LOC126874755 [Bombus huntii]|uniref:uncharacterized protein LOC126874755 n=1 Tax=Bombus huntii TaxID=85661 RepID=UPI0021AA656D|nr:uncharacterized protein LOC126874755 [Bombus huntii]
MNEDCFEDTSEGDQYELVQSKADSESSVYIEGEEIERSSNNEEETYLEACGNKKRMRILSSSDSEDERTNIPSTSQNDIAGPTGYAKRNIISGCGTSAFEWIIDRHIMEHIKDCTETEAHRVLKKDWTITVAELRSFLGILYVQGTHEARSLKASERLQTDKFVLICEIWNRFISNSQACYKPFENISIDE